MSDDNRMIIDSANFSRNLPKWATEDTLERLGRMIGNTSKESQKTLNDISKAMRTLSTKEADVFKEIQSGNKETQKELRNITKVLTQQSNATSTSKPSKPEGSNKKFEQVVHSELVKINTGTQKTVESILNGNDQVSFQLKKANDAHERVSTELIKIYSEIRRLTQNIGNNSSSSTSSVSDSEDRISSQQSDKKVDKTNDVLGDIKGLLGEQNKIQNNILNRTVSSTQFNTMLNNNANRVSKNYRDANQSSMGDLGDMFKRASKSTRGSGAGTKNARLMGKAAASLSSVTKNISRLLKTTLIGKLLQAGMMAYTAATKTFEYAFDVQKEFHDMVNRGFNFGELTQRVGSDRLDGVSVRRTITRNDIGLETATKVLENNTRLINEVGLATTFGELGNIIGDVKDPNSVTNRLMLTRDEVALIATDFYGIHRRLNSITRDFTALDRQNAAIDFIENVRFMSQEIGVGIPKIREAIEQFTKSDEYAVMSTYNTPEQNQNVANLAGNVMADDTLHEDLKRLIMTGVTSPLGLHDSKLRELWTPATADVFSEYAPQFQRAGNMGIEEQNNFVNSFLRSLADSVEDKDTKGMSINPEIARSIAMMASARGSYQQRMSDDSVEGGKDMSELARGARELENLGILIDARTEDMFAAAADSKEGRAVIKGMHKIDEFMKNSQLSLISLTKDVVAGLFSGPIPTIIRSIKWLFDKIAKAQNWLSGQRHEGDITGNKADNTIKTIREAVFGEKSFDKLFDATTDDSGKTTYEIKEGFHPKDISDMFTEMYKSAESEEDRARIAATIKSISRGLSGRDLEMSEKSTRMFGEAMSDFTGEAARTVSGDERDSLVDAMDGFKDSTRLFDGLLKEGRASTEPGIFGGRSSNDIGAEYKDTSSSIKGNAPIVDRAAARASTRAETEQDPEDIAKKSKDGTAGNVRYDDQGNLIEGKPRLYLEPETEDGTEKVIANTEESVSEIKKLSDTAIDIANLIGEKAREERRERENQSTLDFGFFVPTKDDISEMFDSMSKELKSDKEELPDIDFVDEAARRAYERNLEIAKSMQEAEKAKSTLDLGFFTSGKSHAERLFDMIGEMSRSEGAGKYRDTTPNVDSPDNTPEEKSDDKPTVNRGQGGVRIGESKPEVKNDSDVAADIINEIQKEKVNAEYTERMKESSGQNSITEEGNNIVDNTSINNNNDLSGMESRLKIIADNQLTQINSIERNTRILERYINIQV